MRRVKKNRYGDIRHQRDSPGERSGSSSSVGSGRSNEGGSRSGRRYSRSYSRSRSRSPDIQGEFGGGMCHGSLWLWHSLVL